MYMCDDSLCIPAEFVCDGVYDCSTMDDEENCDDGESQYCISDNFCIKPIEQMYFPVL